MASYDLSFSGVSIPANSGGASVTVEEDSDSDGTVENTDTISLSDGVTSYTTADAFDGTGQVRLDYDLGPPSDVTTTASVTVPVDITRREFLDAEVGATTSSGQSATLDPSTVTLAADVASTVSVGQAAALDPGVAALTASIGSTTTAGQPATLALGTTTLTAEIATTTSDGQTATLTAPVWMLDGWPLRATESMTLTPSSVTLSFDATESTIDHWREYDRAGDYRQQREYGGGWQLVDDGGRTDKASATPPAEMKPPLDDVTGYVQAYNEQQASADRYDLDVTIQRVTERRDVYPSVDESGGDWGLAFEHGDLALRADQVGRAAQRGSTAGGQWSVSLFVSDTEAGVVADSAGVPGAVVERPVGDAGDYLQDASSDDVQTVTIDAPADAALPGGTYFVTDWSLSLNVPGGRRRWQVELELADYGPLIVPSGYTYVIEEGDVERHTRVDEDGTLVVNGTLIITG